MSAMNEARHVAAEPPVLAPGPVAPPRQSSAQLGATGNLSRSGIIRARPPKKRWPIFLALAVFASIVVVILLVVTSTGPEEIKFTRPTTLKVERRAFAAVLHEMGTIEALVETPVLTRISGDIVWKTDDGKAVEPGEPVVRFETKAIQDDIESREKDLFDKQEAVRRAERSIKMTTDRYKHVIRQAEIQLELAEIDRKVILEAPTAEEKLDAELTLRSATLDLEKTEVEMKDHNELAKLGYVSDATRKKKELELATTKVNHAKSKLIYDLTLMGYTPDSKRVAELAVADAKKRLNIAKFNRDADLAVLESDLELAKVTLLNFQRELNRKKQDLESATVRAPSKGNVVFIDVMKGRSNKSPIQVGENRSAGGDLCVICDTSTLRVQVWINESDVKSLALGQKATILLPACPGKTYEAVVSDLAVVAMDKNMALSSLALRKSGEAFVNVVQAKLDFINLTEEDRKAIKMGFTADVLLHVSEKTDTLTVPWEAVRYDAQGTPYADVVSGSSRERRTLKLGRSDPDRVEVLEGLKADEQVLDQTLAMFAGGPK
jgi:multidrug efflux pump subunit AcrA (membrane-fusion protein)